MPLQVMDYYHQQDGYFASGEIRMPIDPNTYFDHLEGVQHIYLKQTQPAIANNPAAFIASSFGSIKPLTNVNAEAVNIIPAIQIMTSSMLTKL